jgi:alpha-mannosidase
VRLAAELNQPPFPLLESFHAGPLPAVSSFASDGGGSVIVTVLKRAEDDDGDLIVRAYESAGRATRATIELPLVDLTIDADFGPAEIKTFRIPRDGAPIVETSLLEWE